MATLAAGSSSPATTNAEVEFKWLTRTPKSIPKNPLRNVRGRSDSQTEQGAVAVRAGRVELVSSIFTAAAGCPAARARCPACDILTPRRIPGGARCAVACAGLGLPLDRSPVTSAAYASNWIADLPKHLSLSMTCLHGAVMHSGSPLPHATTGVKGRHCRTGPHLRDRVTCVARHTHAPCCPRTAVRQGAAEIEAT